MAVEVAEKVADLLAGSPPARSPGRHGGIPFMWLGLHLSHQMTRRWYVLPAVVFGVCNSEVNAVLVDQWGSTAGYVFGVASWEDA